MAPRTVVIGNISLDVGKYVLRSVCSRYGRITGLYTKAREDTMTQVAHVRYEEIESANNALEGFVHDAAVSGLNGERTPTIRRYIPAATQPSPTPPIQLGGDRSAAELPPPPPPRSAPSWPLSSVPPRPPWSATPPQPLAKTLLLARDAWGVEQSDGSSSCVDVSVEGSTQPGTPSGRWSPVVSVAPKCAAESEAMADLLEASTDTQGGWV